MGALKTDVKIQTKNIVLLLLNTLAIIASIVFVVLFYTILKKYIPDSVVGVVCTILGILIPIEKGLIENCMDTMPWEVYLRYLIRKKQIDKNTPVRTLFVAFAVVEVENKYLLLKNKHGIGLYQMPSKKYQITYEKKQELEDIFRTLPDDYNPKKDSYDYSFLVKAKYLKKFYKSFLNDVNPKTYNYVKIVEKIVKTCDLDENMFQNTKMTFKTRVVRPISFSRFTNHYEMVCCDVVVLEPTEEQYKELSKIVDKETEAYKFATLKNIQSHGVEPENNKRYADIIEGAYDLILAAKNEND